MKASVIMIFLCVFYTIACAEQGLKPIQDIQVGDKVLALDERTQQTSYQPVLQLIQNKGMLPQNPFRRLKADPTRFLKIMGIQHITVMEIGNNIAEKVNLTEIYQDPMSKRALLILTRMGKHFLETMCESRDLKKCVHEEVN